VHECVGADWVSTRVVAGWAPGQGRGLVDGLCVRDGPCVWVARARLCGRPVGLSGCLLVGLAARRSTSTAVRLSVGRSLGLSAGLSVCASVCPSVCLAVCLYVGRIGWLSVCPSVCRSVCLSVCLSVCRSVWLGVGLSVCLLV